MVLSFFKYVPVYLFLEYIYYIPVYRYLRVCGLLEIKKLRFYRISGKKIQLQ